MATNDFISYSLGFNTSAFQREFESCVNIALDWLSGKMHDRKADNYKNVDFIEKSLGLTEAIKSRWRLRGEYFRGTTIIR